MSRDAIIRDQMNLIKQGRLIPAAAEGRFCIDLTDPVTGKVKSRYKDKNHVFVESIARGFPWHNRLSQYALLCCNDSTADIDNTIPYLMGQTIAYGRPSTAGSGNYRGAYNAANQVLAQATATSMYWKYQYDFTTAQGNTGTIGNIGLTTQYLYSSGGGDYPLSYFPVKASSGAISDGVYSYSVTNAGLITKTNMITGVVTTIDVSAIVGSVSGDQKTIGFGLDTGYGFIYVYSSTAVNRKMYVFTDMTFSALTNTYPWSNGTQITTGTICMYVWGNYAYLIALRSNTIYKGNFVSNGAMTNYSVSSAINNAALIEAAGNTSYVVPYFYSGFVPLNSKYLYGAGSGNYSQYGGAILDLSLGGTVVAHLAGAPAQSPMAIYPITTEKIACANNGYSNTAISAKKLDTPIMKTTANGMTITYELEVFFG